MKNILITGSTSYIGTSFQQWILESAQAEQYQTTTLSVRGQEWRERSFAGYDVVVHVAGLAHQKETAENAHLYEEINCNLAVEVAQKAKEEGVGQFVFLSSMSVYGLDTGVITPDTPEKPKTHYGKSKLHAEALLAELESPTFLVAIIRPPMVYGLNCKGNFQSIIKIVKKSPIFPAVKNQRSMIYIDHLSAFIQLVIDRNCRGILLPQNQSYGNTTEMAVCIADALGRKIRISSLAGAAVCAMKPFAAVAQKAFGSLVYQGTEQFDFCYCTKTTEETYRLSVQR